MAHPIGVWTWVEYGGGGAIGADRARQVIGEGAMLETWAGAWNGMRSKVVGTPWRDTRIAVNVRWDLLYPCSFWRSVVSIRSVAREDSSDGCRIFPFCIDFLRRDIEEVEPEQQKRSTNTTAENLCLLSYTLAIDKDVIRIHFAGELLILFTESLEILDA